MLYTDRGCQDSGRPIVLCLCGCQDSGRPIVLFMHTYHGCQDSSRPIVLCLCILITDVRIVVDP